MACSNCPPSQETCDCPIKDLSTDCSIYNGTEILTHIGTQPGTLMTQVLININNSLLNLKDSLSNYFKLGNIGTGAVIYSGISSLGIRELRSILQGDNVIITELTNEIEISVDDASTTTKGVIEIATQLEVDGETDALRAVTPATLTPYLTAFVLDPANLPLATETAAGISERATSAEVITGTDAIRYISPLGLSARTATETRTGLIELATQAEVTAVTDTERAVTPATLGVFTSAYVSNPANLPLATETEVGVSERATIAEVQAGADTTRYISPAGLSARTATETRTGILEVATTAEANALSVDDKIITPGKLPIASETQQGLSEIATQVEVDAGVDDVRYVTPLKLQSKLGALPTAVQVYTNLISVWSKNTILSPVAHGIGALPFMAKINLVCTVPNNGYAVGDRANSVDFYLDNTGGGTTNRGMGIKYNATNFTVSVTGNVYIPDYDSGVGELVDIDDTQFDIEVVLLYL